ncbi:hypothetical protein [Maribacter sp. R77961]|uniref:hypothetical protein n=1 Tax=Maribacter sp. R77961 TaxID=3093871 RepID=UPI0037C96247
MKNTMLLRFIKRWYFPAFGVLALLVYVSQKFGIVLPVLITNYGNDVLCMPIVLKICQYAVRQLKSDPSLQIPIALVITLTLGYAVYFEWYLPLYNPRYTADGIDVVLYAIGALFFMAIERYGITERPILAGSQDV